MFGMPDIRRPAVGRTRLKNGLPNAFMGTAAVTHAPPFTYTSGNWYSSFPSQEITTASGTAMVAGSIYYQAFYLIAPVVIQAIGLRISAMSSGSVAMAFAIYTNNPANNSPQYLIANSAGAASTATGGYSQALSPATPLLQPGWYWLAFQAPDATIRPYIWNGGAGNLLGQFLGVWGASSVGIAVGSASVASPFFSQTGTTGTWPNPAGGANGAATTVPTMCFQVL